MFQQTHLVEGHDNKTVYQANGRYVKSFVGILQIVGSVVRKSAAVLLNGFHTFVTNAEQPRSPQNDYWWDSRETVDDLLNR